MNQILTINQNFKTYENDIRALLQAFCPGAEIVFADDGASDCKRVSYLKERENCTESEHMVQLGKTAAYKADADQNANSDLIGVKADSEFLTISVDTICADVERSEDRFTDKSAVKKAIYEEMSRITGRTLPWGTLTGIRPVRIVERTLRELEMNCGEASAAEWISTSSVQVTTHEELTSSTRVTAHKELNSSAHVTGHEKPASSVLEEGHEELHENNILTSARQLIRERYLVSEEKLDLMFFIHQREQEVLDRLCRSGLKFSISAGTADSINHITGTDSAGLTNSAKSADHDSPDGKSLYHDQTYKDGFSLYINIPFCPTRCLYCSFTSNPIELWQDRVEEYLYCLKKELLQIRGMMDPGMDFKSDAENSIQDEDVGNAGHQTQCLIDKNTEKQFETFHRNDNAAGVDNAKRPLHGKRLQTVYIGGGTPTALTAGQLDQLLTMIEDIFAPFDSVSELTVESGRPDSITREKLAVMRAHHVDRISINPQTMHQKTLDLIGRRHTVEDTKAAFLLARQMGFDNINMDLIMGLPGEDLKDVEKTLAAVEALHPESLTVHALAVKRSSRLSTEGKAWGGVERKGLDAEGIDEVAAMTGLGIKAAARMGEEPYYLYRQKNMAGNQENVGYAVPGKECIYNILMMEEKHTVIGVGAGASTKWVEYPGEPGQRAEETGKPEKTVRRFENVKNIGDYLARIDELLEKRMQFFRMADK